MSRLLIACVLALLSAAPAAAADLPPGAIARLGDDRFRAGGAVLGFALSPDGKQYATATIAEGDTFALTTWDAATGRAIREQRVNIHLFRGVVWTATGVQAVVIRAEAARGKDELGKLYPDDFRVWVFADPKVPAPPVLPTMLSFHTGSNLLAARPKAGPEYGGFTFSADGKRAAATWKSGDGKRHAVHVFDLKPADSATKLARVGTLDLGAEGADGVRLSADGKTLVVFRKLFRQAVPDGWTATEWDVATGKPGRPAAVPATNSLILTPDARALVLFTLAWDEREWGFDLFTLATGERKKLTRWRFTQEQIDGGGPAEPGAFAFSTNGRELAVSSGGTTHVIDVAKAKELGRLEGHAGYVSAVAWATDGESLATADAAGLVRFWDANTLRPFDEVKDHRAPVRYAELSPDGKRVLTWAEDATVRLWDLATGKELRAFAGAPALCAHEKHGDQWPNIFFNAPTFTPDGTAILYSTKRKLIARDLQTGLEVPLRGELAKLEKPRFAVFSPDGKSVMTWASDGGLLEACEVWDWPGGKKRFELDDWLKEVNAAGFSPDGAAMFVDPRTPKRWDANSGKELPPAWKDERRNSVDPLLSLRPNPNWLFHRPDKGDDQIIEAGTGKVISRFRFAYHGDPFEADLNPHWGVAISPAGGHYACADGLGSDVVQLREAASCTVRRVLKGHRGEVRVLGFTPDGTKLLTAGGDHTVVVWDMRLAHVPLPEALKKETDAAKLWATLATGKADAAYLAMARLAREPDTATKLLKMKLKPAAKGGKETDAAKLTDARAIELLEALDTDDSRQLLKELAGGHADAFRTQEAKRAIERAAEVKRQSNGK